MKRFLKNHELSLWLAVVYVAMTGLGAIIPEGRISQFMVDHSSEVFGALLVVFAKQILDLREKGNKDGPS